MAASQPTRRPNKLESEPSNRLVTGLDWTCFVPLLQSGSRTARPADALSHACWRCGVGTVTKSCCCTILASGSGFSAYSVTVLAQSRVWLNGGGAVADCVGGSSSRPLTSPRLRRSPRCCSMTSSPWQRELGTAGKLTCVDSLTGRPPEQTGAGWCGIMVHLKTGGTSGCPNLRTQPVTCL